MQNNINYNNYKHNQKLTDLKNLYNNNINENKFNDFIVNICNGTNLSNFIEYYSKNLSNLEWIKHFERYNIFINEEQLILLFKYLITYYDDYFEKYNNIYRVNKKYCIDVTNNKKIFNWELEHLYFLDL